MERCTRIIISLFFARFNWIRSPSRLWSVDLAKRLSLSIACLVCWPLKIPSVLLLWLFHSFWAISLSIWDWLPVLRSLVVLCISSSGHWTRTIVVLMTCLAVASTLWNLRAVASALWNLRPEPKALCLLWCLELYSRR